MLHAQAGPKGLVRKEDAIDEARQLPRGIQDRRVGSEAQSALLQLEHRRARRKPADGRQLERLGDARVGVGVEVEADHLLIALQGHH